LIVRKLVIISSILVLLTGMQSRAQQRQNDCGTPVRFPLKQVDTALLQQRSVLATLPYPVKIFVVVFADNDGTNLGASEADILRQIDNMRGFYAPHNICFILTGMEQVNSTDLNSHDTDSETIELAPYLRSGMITIFVHASLFSASDGGWNGFAYDIPNTFLSIVRSAISSTTNLSTLTHEMGHCVGLYHTFQSRRDGNDNIIRENRARSGGCKNCETEGDLLCDTDADRNNDDANISSSTCAYIGPNTIDACGSSLLMEPTNIMTYGRRSCRNNFTSGQGARARAFLAFDPTLAATLADDALTQSAVATFNAGERIYAARNTVTFDPISTISYGGTSRTHVSSKAVIIKAGTNFTPTSNSGYAHLRAGTLCN
jgi:hypothetical protein